MTQSTYRIRIRYTHRDTQKYNTYIAYIFTIIYTFIRANVYIRYLVYTLKSYRKTHTKQATFGSFNVQLYLPTTTVVGLRIYTWCEIKWGSSFCCFTTLYPIIIIIFDSSSGGGSSTVCGVALPEVKYKTQNVFSVYTSYSGVHAIHTYTLHGNSSHTRKHPYNFCVCIKITK